MSNGLPCAGAISQVASSRSPPQGGFLSVDVVSTNAVAKGASATRAPNDDSWPYGSCGRCQRVPHANVAGPTAVSWSTASVLPETARLPRALTWNVSCAGPAVTVSRCLTWAGRLFRPPAGADETENDGLAAAEAGRASNTRAASAGRRSMWALDHTFAMHPGMILD